MGLDRLPDDVLLLCLGYLESARDLASLAQSCRRLHLLVEGEDGWRIFVRDHFPSLQLPPASDRDWRELAESLTWQSRCWDRRSLTFRAMVTRPRSTRVGQRRTIPFHPVLDAHLDLDSRTELVVWGAGENIVARRRTRPTRESATESRWYRSDGKDYGYAPGYDDIKALSIVKDVGGQVGELGILAGRDNGHLSLLSAADDSFARNIANYGPALATEEADGSTPGQLPKQGTINSLDVLSRRNLFAATTKSTVFVYPLTDHDEKEIRPSSVFDLEGQAFEHKNMALINARWMTDDLLALGLQGCRDPLRYLTITPSGFRVSNAAKNEYLEDKFAIDYGRLCANSLVPVIGSHGGHNLLLSAWRDGTVRLQDVRSPSPFDSVYCDNIDPWSEFETLLTYGTERFVAGGIHGATVKVFDFRWTKDYYHTSALPCGGDKPFPVPHQPFATSPKDDLPARSCCDHLLGYRCRWHELSRDIYYRPNCSFFLSKSLPPEEKHAGVWSLAKASDISPNFYVGISGGVVEAILGTDGVDPNLGYDTLEYSSSQSVSYKTVDLEPSMMEIGDGLASPQNDRNIRIPTMRGKGWGLPDQQNLRWDNLGRRHRHRLDVQFQAADDFRRDLNEDGEVPWWRMNAVDMLPRPIGGRAVVRDI